MRIGQVAPLYESVPPLRYGGTERVVSWLTEELVRNGHEVTLFASGDSRTTSRLIPCSRRSLRTDPDCRDYIAHHIALIERVAQAASRFDIIHFHIDYLHFPFSRNERLCQITTLHGRLDLADLVPIYREFREMPVVSISRAQRKPLPWINWAGNVHHGLPPDYYRLDSGSRGYLAFIGRISPEKRPDRAIEIAKRTRIPLKIAAKIDRVDTEYFEREIKHLLSDPLVEFIGEITDSEKQEFLGNALACLMPIDWPEPFGINMIEAMACGTPTVAFRHGSVPEIITDGLNGFIVDSVEEAVEAVSRVPVLSRADCRQVFEERFTAGRMAADYLRIYEEQLCASASARQISSTTIASKTASLASQ
ncbi:MAG TPA: glycosyltransferase family 4 protein [Candidatus Acidoferrales bacterium]|nr:glycosyltransferase family 4 protein [Candidatus Acidoferrales bacterium]